MGQRGGLLQHERDPADDLDNFSEGGEDQYF